MLKLHFTINYGIGYIMVMFPFNNNQLFLFCVFLLFMFAWNQRQTNLLEVWRLSLKQKSKQTTSLQKNLLPLNNVQRFAECKPWLKLLCQSYMQTNKSDPPHSIDIQFCFTTHRDKRLSTIYLFLLFYKFK